jgi:hypothetical protein
MNRLTVVSLISLIQTTVLTIAASGGTIHLGSGGVAAHSEQTSLHNQALYLRLVDQRDANPLVFDRKHPFYGKLFAKESVFDYWVDRWQSHEARFEHWHPCLWRVLDGGLQVRDHTNPGDPGSTPPLINPVPIVLDPPSNGSGNPSQGPLPPTVHTVPEPMSVISLAIGLGLFLIVLTARRAKRDIRVLSGCHQG